MKNCIETHSGKFVDLLNPQPEQIDIYDMAWALSRVPRYVGHTTGQLPYSVGQHSLAAYRIACRLKNDEDGRLWDRFMTSVGDLGYVREYINTPVLLHVLVHDCSEAYLMDLPTPLKRLPGMAESYGVYERKMMEAIWASLGLSPPDQFTEDVIAWVDRYVLTVEVDNLIPSRGKDWTSLMKLSRHELEDFDLPRWPWAEYEEFKDVATELVAMVAERR